MILGLLFVSVSSTFIFSIFAMFVISEFLIVFLSSEFNSYLRNLLFFLLRLLEFLVFVSLLPSFICKLLSCITDLFVSSLILFLLLLSIVITFDKDGISSEFMLFLLNSIE